MSKPLDQYMNLQFRIGCIMHQCTENNWRIYMPQLIDILNELSTRQLKCKAGTNDVQKVRAALRNERAKQDMEQYPDLCTHWELHGTEFQTQYVTSVKSTMPGAESCIPSLIIQRIRDMKPVGKVGGKKAPKTAAAAQSNIDELSEQLQAASIQASQVTQLKLQLEDAHGEIEVLRQKVADLIDVPTEGYRLQAMAGMVAEILGIVYKAIQEHGSSTFSRMDDLVAPKIPIVDLYEKIQKLGHLPDGVDTFVKLCIKTLRPLWPRPIGKTEFVGAKDTQYHGVTMHLPVYTTVMCPAVEFPHRHVTPFLMSNVKWFREPVLEFIKQHNPDFYDEAVSLCDDCNVARDRR